MNPIDVSLFVSLSISLIVLINILPFFGTTGRVNVLLDVEVGLLLAKKVLNPSLRAFGLYFYIILSVDYHGY